MASMWDYLDRKYSVLGQQAGGGANPAAPPAPGATSAGLRPPASNQLRGQADWVAAHNARIDAGAHANDAVLKGFLAGEVPTRSIGNGFMTQRFGADAKGLGGMVVGGGIGQAYDKTDAEIAAIRANAAEGMGRTRMLDTQRQYYPEVIRSEIGLRGAQVRGLDATADATRSATSQGLADQSFLRDALEEEIEAERARRDPLGTFTRGLPTISSWFDTYKRRRATSQY